MKLDHERARVHAEEVVKLKETVACLGNLSKLSACYLGAMTRLDKAEKERDGWKDAYFELIRAIGSTPGNSKSPVSVAHELMARLDKATELLRASAAHLEDCARDIVLRRAEEVLQARGNLALEMANRLRAFLAAERK